MSKKSRLHKDAFDWVKHTSAEKDTASDTETPAEPMDTAPEKSPRPNSGSLPDRRVYVKYRLDDGSIISIVEASTDRHPFVRVGSDEAVFSCRLSGDSETQSLVTIHRAHRVKTTGRTPSLMKVE